MRSTRYKRGNAYAADMAVYMRNISECNTNSNEISRLKRNLVMCLNEDVTERQRTVLLMYYGEGKNMREIGEHLGIDKSTVSRTIKRGERRLLKCLRYGAETYLKGLSD